MCWLVWWEGQRVGRGGTRKKRTHVIFVHVIGAWGPGAGHSFYVPLSGRGRDLSLNGLCVPGNAREHTFAP